MPNPGVQIAVHRAQSGGNQFPGEYHLDWYNNSLQGSNLPDDYIGADGVQQQPDPRAQQRDRQLLRPRHQRRRPDQEGQGVVVRHLPQAEERRGAAELPVRQDVRHAAVERRRQGHLPDQPEEQDDRLLPVGPEGAAEPPAVDGDLHLRVARARPTRRTRAAGSTRASGTARSATSCISKRATATSATTSRCSPTATRTTSSATPAALTVQGAHQKLAARSRPQAVQPGAAPTSSTPPARQPHLQDGREMLREKGRGKASSSAGAATSSTIYANGVAERR